MSVRPGVVPAPHLRRLTTHDRDDVEPREVVDRAVAPGEVVGHVEPEQQREVDAAVRDVGRGRSAARVGPVHDAGDAAALPQDVAGMEVAVTEDRRVRGHRPARERDRAAPHVGPARPARRLAETVEAPRPVLEERVERDGRGVDRAQAPRPSRRGTGRDRAARARRGRGGGVITTAGTSAAAPSGSAASRRGTVRPGVPASAVSAAASFSTTPGSGG